MKLFNTVFFCLLGVVCARPAFSQDREFAGPWRPMGPVPVDQAGAGRRGYALPGESTDVADPQASQVSFHFVGANNFYIEDDGPFSISQRTENHTLAVDYRRGFKKGTLPFELGAQIQISEADEGMLNGFITGFEDFVHAPLRSRTLVMPPLGTRIVRDGRTIYQTSGAGSGFGDVTLTAKALVRDRPLESGETRVAVRAAVNVSGASEFTEGNYAGVGVSVDRKLTGWIALHGDIRANVLLDTTSVWGLPLTRGVFAFSAGPELRLTRNTSLGLQWDGSTSPYQPIGSTGIDSGYGDVAFGLNHRFVAGRRTVVAQLYGRENMDLPFSVRWNADPDFAVGLKFTVR